MAAPRAPFSFRAKLTALAIGLVSVPLAVAGLYLFNVNADAVKTLSRELQLAILADAAGTIDSTLGDAERALGSVAGVLGSDARSPGERLGIALSLVEGSQSIDQVAIFDAGGRFIDRIRDEGAPAAADVLPDGLRAAAAAGPALGPVELAGGEARVPIVVAIRAGGKVTGYCSSPISFAGVQRRLEEIAGARFPDDAGALYVLDERRHIIAHSDRELAGSLASPDEDALAWIEQGSLAAGVARSGEYVDRDGHAMVGSTVRLGRHPFTVVAELRRDVAYASLGAMERTGLLVLAGSLILGIAVALLVAGRISRPIRRLSDYAGALAERRFGERIEVGTRDELHLLARAMSGAAAELERSEARIREEAAIRADLRRYLPGDLVDKVVRREQDMALGGTRREVTVLFADVVGFTPLTDKLGAEEVVSLLNELFTILTEIVFRHGGTVDKFIGDCVMAVWGAPAAQDDHARRALAAASDMMSWLEAGNAAWQARLGVKIELAIGVNTGEAVVGNVGSETRMEYTAIGDVVNVAARLETIARPQQILLTAATRAAAGDAVATTDLGEKSLPGRAAPLRLYEVRA